MKKFTEKFINILIIIALCSSFLEPFVNISIVANAAASDNYVYLSDLWDDKDVLLTKESSWKDVRALKVNQNEPGNLISVNLDGEQTYFINGIFAHATSTLIFDLKEYKEKGFNMFSAFVGVDTYAGSNGDGVAFTIYGSNDNKNYTQLKSISTLKGTSNAVEVKLSISEYRYLKLYAYANGNNSSDHAVYANAMLYNSNTYQPNMNSSVDWIRPLSEYDEELKRHPEEDIINNEELELKLLQRTLVKRVGYQIMQAYATSDDDKAAVLKWLFTDKEALKTYITGGEPLGNYINSFNVLTKLYNTYKDDLKNEDETKRETFLKMMMAISLTHSGTVAFWTTGEGNTQVISDPVKRYKAFKDLYLHQNYPTEYEFEQTFNVEVFESLTVEEMRWVVDARLSDEELPWLNWYSSHLEETKYSGEDGKRKSSMDPYTYIWYNDSFKWAYTDPGYYEKDSNYCAPDIKTPVVDGYVRNTKCNDIYHTEEWGIKSDTNTQPRLWVVWEEDGVCGALSKTGENLNNSYGQVAAVTKQPAHAAYLIQTKTKKDGKFVTTWGIGNDVHGWAKSSGTEKGERLPLNWGTTTLSYSSDYNASYVILAQAAIDDFKNYVKSLEYKLIADIYEENYEKQEKIYRKIVGTANIVDITTEKNRNAIQNFNLDGWYGLIQTYLKNPTKDSADYRHLSYEIMANLKEYPLAMNDMLNLITEKMENSDKSKVNTAFKKILNELVNVQNDSTEYKQGQAVRQVAQYLNGQKEETAKFSFSGENANKIVLATEQPFEYALDYSYDTQTKLVHANWTKVTNGTTADLTEVLEKITPDKDIVVHIIGDSDYSPTSDSITIINIEEGTTPKNLYANDLENKVFGITDSMEWKIDGEKTSTWTKFSEKEPNLSGIKTVLVRDGAHDTYLPSEAVSLTFDADPDADQTKVYVPISRLKVEASSQQNSSSEAAARAIDGNKNTYWHNLWSGSDTARWITIEVTDEDPIDLSKIEYMPRQDSGTNGIFTKVKLEVSLDGKKWDVIDDNIKWNSDKSTKTYILQRPALAKYIRLTALESAGNFASAAMINIFENKTTRTSVEELSVNYISNGFVYDGTPKTPEVIVKHGDTTLIKDEDYTIEYSDNVNAGKGKISIKGMGAYVGRRSFEFEIKKAPFPPSAPPRNIIVEMSELDTHGESDYGKVIPYLFYVKLPNGWGWAPKEMGTILKSGEPIKATAEYYGDEEGWTEEMANNFESNQVEVTVTLINGSRPKVELNTKDELKFDISKASDKKDKEYFKSLLIVTDEEDDKEDKDLSITVNEELTDWPTWNKVGTYHIAFTITDSDNNSVDYQIEFTLYDSTNDEKIDISNPKEFVVEIIDNALIFNGSEIKPEVIVKDQNNHILTLGKDYVIEYINNKVAGPAKMIIKGIGLLYKGEQTKDFTIEKAKVPSVLPNEEIEVSPDVTSLSDVTLPQGWSWEDENVKLKEGENTLTIIFAGDENHEPYKMTVKVIKDSTKKREIVESKPTNPTPSTPSESETKPSETTPQVKPTESENDKEEQNTTNNTTSKPSSSNKETTNEEESNQTEDNKVEETQTTNDEQTTEDKQEQDNEVETNEEQKVLKKEQDTPKKKISNQVIVMATVVVSLVTLGGVAFLLIKIK